jgi:hypothetical protein
METSRALVGLSEEDQTSNQRKHLYAAKSTYFIANIFLSYTGMVYLGWELLSINRIVGLRVICRP